MSGEQGSEAGVGGIAQPISGDASMPEAVAAGGSGAASGEPTAVSSIEQASSGALSAPVTPAAKGRKPVTCGNCGETGHNKRTCSQQPSADSPGAGGSGAAKAAAPSPAKAAAKAPAKAAAKASSEKKKKAARTGGARMRLRTLTRSVSLPRREVLVGNTRVLILFSPLSPNSPLFLQPVYIWLGTGPYVWGLL
jgi:hypothetical protein